MEVEGNDVLPVLGIATQGIEHRPDILADMPGGTFSGGFIGVRVLSESLVTVRIGGVPIVNASERGGEVFAEFGDVVGFDDDGRDGVVAGMKFSLVVIGWFDEGFVDKSDAFCVRVPLELLIVVILRPKFKDKRT